MLKNIDNWKERTSRHLEVEIGVRVARPATEEEIQEDQINQYRSGLDAVDREGDEDE